MIGGFAESHLQELTEDQLGSFEELLDALDRQRAMHQAVDRVKAPWLAGRSFRGSRTA